MRLDTILRIAAKFILPLMLVFALYVQFHGDYGPGGGFQAGVVAAASIILYALIYGLPSALKIVPPGAVETMVPLGALIYLVVGLVGMLTGGNFLYYSELAHDQIHGQEWGVFLVEIGVFVTVFSTMLSIFYAFVGRAGR